MLYLHIFIFAMLLFIAWQDFTFKAVYWWLFVMLLLALAVAKWVQGNWQMLQQDFTTNILFLFFQILVLHLYFSFKERKIINLFKGYFGLGDLFFLIAMAVYFSFFNYLLFYTSSLLIVILFNLILKYKVKNVDEKIPLAGKQAILLTVFLIVDQLNTSVNFTADTWLIHYLGI